jgi:hypothetical protein
METDYWGFKGKVPAFSSHTLPQFPADTFPRDTATVEKICEFCVNKVGFSKTENLAEGDSMINPPKQ